MSNVLHMTNMPGRVTPIRKVTESQPPLQVPATAVTTSGQVAGVLQAQRVTTGSILASATGQVTLTWTTAFANANYTPMASVLDSSGNLQVVDIASYSATQVVVNVKNNDGAGAHTGTLLVFAMHD